MTIEWTAKRGGFTGKVFRVIAAAVVGDLIQVTQFEGFGDDGRPVLKTSWDIEPWSWTVDFPYYAGKVWRA